MAHAPEQTIRRFYQAFAQGDAATMGACYAPDVTFYDPVFETLRGDEARAMWRMLTGRSKDLAVTLDHVSMDGGDGRAQWTARYTFTKTGRPVVNVIQARFRFTPDGLIADHKDDFDFWRWSRQALGPVGVLLGWSPVVKNKVRAEAKKGLAEFRLKHGGR